jgi:hypothetical protein
MMGDAKVIPIGTAIERGRIPHEVSKKKVIKIQPAGEKASSPRPKEG